MNGRPAVLVIAGSDASGGAGMQRDLRVLAELPLDVVCAVTAVTAQSHAALRKVHLVPADMLRAQIAAALESAHVTAIKIGMLGGRDQVLAVSEALAGVRAPIVLDPVLAASSGGTLLDAPGLEAMRTHLFAHVTVLTPNRIEAARLCHQAPAEREHEAIEQARELLHAGPQSVWLKGGHAEGADVVDLLLQRDAPPRRYRNRRVKATLRGSGCALSSTLAAGLAMGLSVEDACAQAKRQVHGLFLQAAREDQS